MKWGCGCAHTQPPSASRGNLLLEESLNLTSIVNPETRPPTASITVFSRALARTVRTCCKLVELEEQCRLTFQGRSSAKSDKRRPRDNLSLQFPTAGRSFWLPTPQVV